MLPTGHGIAPAAWVIEAQQAISKTAKAAKQRSRQGAAFPFLWERPARPTDRLMLLTQQCDVVKPPDDFPLVEFGLVLETSTAGVIAEAAMLTSARYFLLSPREAEPPALVLDVRFRTQVDKGALLQHPPDNTVIDAMNRAGQRHLADWLGRRYEREAVEDRDTDEIVEPVRSAWRALSEADPETAARWGHQIAELRYQRNDDDGFILYGVAYEPDADQVAVLEILGWVVEQFSAGIEVELIATNLWEMSVGERLATQEIDLEWASYEES